MTNNTHKRSNFRIHFRLLTNERSQIIKDILYRNKKINVSSINPEDLIYDITTTHNKMKHNFENLKSFLKKGESMGYECYDDKMLCDCFVKPQKVVTIYMS